MIPDSQIFKSKILIVDDEAVNVKLLEQILRNLGFHSIQSTTDPREVVEKYQNYKPDLILLDLKMAHLDGIQVMEKLKEFEEDNWFPVIMITAQPNHTNRLRALEAGAGDFLGKPFDILEFSLRIKNYLKLVILNKMYCRKNITLEKNVAEITDDLRLMKGKLIKETVERVHLEKVVEAYDKNLKNEFDKEVKEIKNLYNFGK
jgi:adenylate cyclase